MWNNVTHVAKENFLFHQTSCTGFFDWREIDHINVDDIIANKDIDAVEKVLPFLTHAPLGGLIHNPILDSNIRKYFRLAQLALQYLLFCKKCLDKTLCGMKTSLEEYNRDNAKLLKLLKKKNDEMLLLQKQITQLQKEEAKERFPCHKCKQDFSAEGQSEHRIESREIKTNFDKSLISSIKLELEVKQLKKRLNLAEKEIESQKLRQDLEICNEFQKGKERVMVDIGTGTQHLVNATVQVDLLEENNVVQFKPLSIKETITEMKELESPKSKSIKNDLKTLNKLDEVLFQQEQLLNVCNKYEREVSKEDINKLQTSIEGAFTLLQKAIEKKQVDLIYKNSLLEESKNPKNDQWDERLKELEYIFSSNHERLHEDLKTLNTCYESKMNTLEKTIKESSFPKDKFDDQHCTTDRYEGEMYRSINIDQNYKVVEPVLPLDFKMSVPEDVVEYKVILNNTKADLSKTVVSKTSCLHKKSKLRVKATKQLDLFTEFRKRMLNLGINSTDQKLSTENLLEIKSKLAQQRLILKEKVQGFSALRTNFNTIATRMSKRKIKKNITDAPGKIICETESDAESLTQRVMETIVEGNSFSSSKSNVKNNDDNENQFENQLNRVLQSPVRRPSLPTNSFDVKSSTPTKHVLFSVQSLRQDADRGTALSNKPTNLARYTSVKNISNL